MERLRIRIGLAVLGVWVISWILTVVDRVFSMGWQIGIEPVVHVAAGLVVGWLFAPKLRGSRLNGDG